ncbi:UNVERIFIED_CONTAM: hypothetical protein GTU68_048925 [Idotea baltica]|nr:hypothetical protein [Idotea baltica]
MCAKVLQSGSTIGRSVAGKQRLRNPLKMLICGSYLMRR